MTARRFDLAAHLRHRKARRDARREAPVDHPPDGPDPARFGGRPPERRHAQPPECDPPGRIAFGAMCSWWDSIDKAAGPTMNGLPCCPHCWGPLYEVDDEPAWWTTAGRELNPVEYVRYLEWVRGQCFLTFAAARDAFKAAQ